jgi:hypothetical protein
VFEQWPVVYPQRPTRRVVHPAQPVAVSLLDALPGRLPDLRRVPLYVRVDGLELTRPCAGLLHAWIRQTTGAWWGLVELELRTGNDQGRFRTRQLIPASALRLLPPDTEPAHASRHP